MPGFIKSTVQTEHVSYKNTEKRFYVLPILSAWAPITWKFEEGKPEKFDDVNKINTTKISCKGKS